MEYTDREFVRKQLERIGYTNITDQTLDEFMAQLKEDDDQSLSPSKGTSSEKPSVSSKSPVSKRPIKLNQVPPKKQPPQVEQEQEIDEEEEEVNDEEEEEIEQMPIKRSMQKPQKTSVGAPKKIKSEKYDEDDEINSWSRKLKSIQTKAQNLDSQIQQCRSAIIDPPTEETDVPLYFGTSERKLDPYPTVKKKMTGGFIRPPPVRSSRKATGPKGRRLLYEERVPDYIPPPERRRDALRWQIRQKLIYSDPKYH